MIDLWGAIYSLIHVDSTPPVSCEVTTGDVAEVGDALLKNDYFSPEMPKLRYGLPVSHGRC